MPPGLFSCRKHLIKFDLIVAQNYDYCVRNSGLKSYTRMNGAPAGCAHFKIVHPAAKLKTEKVVCAQFLICARPFLGVICKNDSGVCINGLLFPDSDNSSSRSVCLEEIGAWLCCWVSRSSEPQGRVLFQTYSTLLP